MNANDVTVENTKDSLNTLGVYLREQRMKLERGESLDLVDQVSLLQQASRNYRMQRVLMEIAEGRTRLNYDELDHEVLLAELLDGLANAMEGCDLNDS